MKDRLLNTTYRVLGYQLASKFHSLIVGAPQNRMGAQCQFDSGEMLRFNRTVRPVALMVINFVKREFLEELIRDNPGVLIIYRPWPDSEWADEPEQQAAEHVERLAREIAPVSDLIHFVRLPARVMRAAQVSMCGAPVINCSNSTLLRALSPMCTAR